MKSLQNTLMILAALVLLTQGVRHGHLLVYGGEKSILDVVDTGYENEERIRKEASDAALLAEYKVVADKVAKLEKGKTSEEIRNLEVAEPEMYRNCRQLRNEIESRQSRRREIRDLWIFSGAGILMILLSGRLFALKSDWLGMSLAIPGFAEILWWSSPSFSMGGAQREYTLLLVNKIAITLIGLVLLYLGWFLLHRRKA